MRWIFAFSTLAVSGLLFACTGASVDQPSPTGEASRPPSSVGSSNQQGAAPGAPSTQLPSAPSPSLPELGAAPMENFQKVTEGIYRGGHPDAAGLDYLKKLGIKTDVDLEIGDLIEASPSVITEEQHEAEARGFTFINAPLSAFEPALSTRFDQQVEKVLSTLQDPASKPIYVHCKHGQDRTGLVIGLERVLIEHQTPQAAHDEMVKIGFHTEFLGLEAYFERKTSWQP
jgi:protein tyrosine/serine phosphatase